MMSNLASPTLSHVNEKNQPTMVDISEKIMTRRSAKARTLVRLPEEVLAVINDGEIKSKKGPVIHTAIIAGVMAAKSTSQLIPFCHPLPIEDCKISAEFSDEGILVIDCEVSVFGKTGVEMEALTGASVAALTVYDMCKAISHNIVIESTHLLFKKGGKSDIVN